MPEGTNIYPAFATTELTDCIGTLIETTAQTLLNGTAAQEIRSLLDRRGVLLFPAIGLTDAQQVAFTATLGTLARQMNEQNGVFRISLDPEETQGYSGYLQASFFWHIDGTTNDVPIRASIMSARGLSANGGETEFANCYAAYDALSPNDKCRLEGLRVSHSFEAVQRYVNPEPSLAELQQWRSYPRKVLPLVWTHRSGRKSLLIGNSADHVLGLSPEDGYELLVRLREHATQSRFVYRHHWQLGDMVIWDNAGTMHRALPYSADSGRLMHRTKLEGEETVI